MSQLCHDAHVSGSLGRAIYRPGIDRDWTVLNAPDAEPQPANKNEWFLFRHIAQRVIPVATQGEPVPLAAVRRKLKDEIAFYTGLDGLLLGMDPEMPERLRKEAITRAQVVMTHDAALRKRIQIDFLIPAASNEWDFQKAEQLAKSIRTNTTNYALDCYKALTDGSVDRVQDDIKTVVANKLGTGLIAPEVRNAIQSSGLAAELIISESQRDEVRLQKLMFRKDEFAARGATTIGSPILAALIACVMARLHEGNPPPRKAPRIPHLIDTPEFEVDPIIRAVEVAKRSIDERRDLPTAGGAGDVPATRRASRWIVNLLIKGKTAAAEIALVKLISRQGQRSRMLHLAMTLTDIANQASRIYQSEFADRILKALEHVEFEDAATRNCRAQWYRDLGLWQEALDYAADSLVKYPNARKVWHRYAIALRDLGRHDEALDHMERFVERFDDDAYGVARLAYSLVDLGRHGAAIERLGGALDRFPTNVVIRNIYAGILRAAGRAPEALEFLRETMRQFSKDEYSRAIYALTLLELEQYQSALEILRQFMKEYPNNPVLRNIYATVLAERGKFDESLDHLRETIRLHPDDNYARNTYANVLIKSGRLDESIEYLRKSIAYFPTDKVARNTLAVALIEAGAYADSLEQLKVTLKGSAAPRRKTAASENPSPGSRHVAEAFEVLKATIVLFPGDSYASGIFAQTLIELRRAEEALMHLARSIDTHVNDSALRNIFAKALVELGRTDEAQDFLIETIQRHPNDVVAPNMLSALIDAFSPPRAI